jgi:ketosteroid isomerase-like protein
MKLRSEPHPDDLEAMRRWFKGLEECVHSVDFAAGRPLFAEDMIAFGTFSDFVAERDDLEREQWRNVWPTIRRFHWRLADVKGIVAADRLSGTGLAIWDSDGFREDGTRFDRRGRATVAFTRRAVGEPWIAVHTHMSLFRGTPAVSHGRFSGPEE